MSCDHFDIRRVTPKGSRNALWECLGCKAVYTLDEFYSIWKETNSNGK